MKKSQLIRIKDAVIGLREERARLGDFDANASIILSILWILQDLVSHAIETYPKKAETKTKKPAASPKRGRKKGHS